jgi:uncharacterized protein
MKSKNMQIAISGSSGFLGSALKKCFQHKGWNVIEIPRFMVNGNQQFNELGSLIEKADVVINLRGASISGRWTKKYMREIYESRIVTTQVLVNSLLSLGRKDVLFISASATGIYQSGMVHSETSVTFSNQFLGKVCKDWEKEAMRAFEHGIRTVIFRSGVIIGNEGGVVKKLSPLFKAGLGAVILPSSGAFPWVHISDWCNACLHVIQNQRSAGIYNVSASHTTTQKDFAKALAKSMKRPLFFVLPGFLLRIFLGRGANALNSNPAVVSERLPEEGFQFRYVNIFDALRGD